MGNESDRILRTHIGKVGRVHRGGGVRLTGTDRGALIILATIGITGKEPAHQGEQQQDPGDDGEAFLHMSYK